MKYKNEIKCLIVVALLAVPSYFIWQTLVAINYTNQTKKQDVIADQMLKDIKSKKHHPSYRNGKVKEFSNMKHEFDNQHNWLKNYKEK